MAAKKLLKFGHCPNWCFDNLLDVLAAFLISSFCLTAILMCLAAFLIYWQPSWCFDSIHFKKCEETFKRKSNLNNHLKSCDLGEQTHMHTHRHPTYSDCWDSIPGVRKWRHLDFWIRSYDQKNKFSDFSSLKGLFYLIKISQKIWNRRPGRLHQLNKKKFYST